MIRKTYLDIDVVSMAKKRIKNIFSSSERIMFCTSGGKDSNCLSHLLYTMCISGEIDKTKLSVEFIDEEAIYPCVERCVNNWRVKWLSIGVPFSWYCIPVRHFSCFNMLTQDESFILWEPGKKWIRQMPPFAITDHPLLRHYKDTYQDFLARKNKAYVVLTGVRASESVQRKVYLAKMKNQKKQYPIYDWTDNDVWMFIRDNNIEIPDAYMYMYQVGMGKKDMRISQFFSVDTVKSLTQVCQYYPDLFNRICEREPNAYLAMLYFDTELFRRSKEKGTGHKFGDVDWKEKCFAYINDTEKFPSDAQKKLRKEVMKTLLRDSFYIKQKNYKRIYEMLVAGDPKGRTLRALYQDIIINKRKMYEDSTGGNE